MTKISEETRDAALAMYEQCGNLRETALAFGVSYESVRQWARRAAWEADAARAQQFQERVSAPRRPIYVNGVRLGRLALWT
jgi:uncharacterized protein YjcR